MLQHLQISLYCHQNLLKRRKKGALTSVQGFKLFRGTKNQSFQGGTHSRILELFCHIKINVNLEVKLPARQCGYPWMLK